ncbi:hypothetical protein SLUN_01195 [Streptomyces lunaelactis]|uniref:ABC3 transporter permease C-terminal domain-containing protein n=1 Tax=Streptomyces lunaelactis TaxID=1535768 RepID=A0A2R4SW44_9ACTN|nr:FtsX-like permease family protein [Streptomyces lunaelactis]AVZ71072.1 hypothetical protein SLUN_01195 [Streptomyces lunaelactis]NUK22654.1 FtsX-like permease family protein [Streptomyces lunaelactis]
MTRLRWRKVARDLWNARTRTAMMILAIAVSLTAVGAVLGARTIVLREIDRNYLGTHPASATLHLSGKPDAAAVADVLDQPDIADATVRGSVKARVRVDGRWEQFMLWVVAPDDPMRISSFTVEQGDWPTPAAEMLLERSSLSYFGVANGGSLEVQTPNGKPQRVTVTGSVHDPSLAPSEQETVGYGYLTEAALQRLGENVALDELKLVVGPDAAHPTRSAEEIEQAAGRAGAVLAERGLRVTAIEVPPPYRHPHQSQMESVTTLLLVFAGLSVVLSAILVATMLGGLLAQQIRQIGMMKAVGARTRQILQLYLLMALLIAAAATALSIVPSLLTGRYLAGVIAELLNIDLVSVAVPAWVFTVQLLAGLGVPLLVALVPLVRGSRVTVRQAIDDHGTGTGDGSVRGTRFTAWLGSQRGIDRSLVMASRNTMRRKGRFALNLTLLAVGGGLFITGLNTAGAWTALVNEGQANRHYDLEVKLNEPVSAATLDGLLRPLPGVADVEAVASWKTAMTGTDGLDVSHTYPDGGHGSFSITAAPPDSPMLTLPVIEGRWLRPDDTDAVVLNQLVPIYQDIEVGDEVSLTVADRPSTWRVVGLVSNFGTHGTAYVTPDGMERAVPVPGQASLIRVATEGHDDDARRAALTQIERTLATEGVNVASAVPVDQLETALDGHVAVLIAILLALAAAMGVVGLLGLGSSMSTSVVERTREFAVLSAVGATPGAVRRIVVSEGVLVAAMSVAIAVVVALPLTRVLGDFVGDQAFHLPLPFNLSGPAVLLWLTLVLVGAAAATMAAAWRAGRLTVREALSAV